MILYDAIKCRMSGCFNVRTWNGPLLCTLQLVRCYLRSKKRTPCVKDTFFRSSVFFHIFTKFVVGILYKKLLDLPSVKTGSVTVRRYVRASMNLPVLSIFLDRFRSNSVREDLQIISLSEFCVANAILYFGVSELLSVFSASLIRFKKKYDTWYIYKTLLGDCEFNENRWSESHILHSFTLLYSDNHTSYWNVH
jgi:hypothetical protein